MTKKRCLQCFLSSPFSFASDVFRWGQKHLIGVFVMKKRNPYPKKSVAGRDRNFPLLEQVTTPTVPTPQAAHYLNRKDQTLRMWACFENGPLRPVRINGRLAWTVLDIKRLLKEGK